MALPDGDRGRPEDASRPAALLFVYSWDILLAIIALVGAFTAFGGGIAVGSREIELPVPLQIVAALSAASFCAALVIVATLLTKRQSWVWRAQVTLLCLAIALAVASVISDGVLVRHGLDLAPVLGSAVFVLLDALALVVLADRRVARWFTQPGPAPAYAWASIGFWAASSAALLVFEAFR